MIDETLRRSSIGLRDLDAVAVANMLINAVFFDDLTHVFEYFLSAGDGRTNPRFETIAEGIKVGV